jgi:hypothetical protein
MFTAAPVALCQIDDMLGFPFGQLDLLLSVVVGKDGAFSHNTGGHGALARDIDNAIVRPGAEYVQQSRRRNQDREMSFRGQSLEKDERKEKAAI